MIRTGSLYSASDKAFYDALCQHKMGKPALQDLLWKRGIVTSNKTEKEDIARYFSRLEHDYFDHKLISEKVSTGSNREKQTTHFLNAVIGLEDLESIAKELVNDRKEIDNSISFVVTKQSVHIEVSYSYYDHNRPEFKQVVTKNGVLSIEISEEGINIRSPDNEYISDITQSVLLRIEEKSGSDFEVDTISLYGINDVEKRIEFFDKLISNMDNMQLHDVSDVAIYNPDTGAQDQLGVHVKRASLNGEGVLKSGELKQFYKKGFFVYRLSWSTVEKGNAKSDIYHFKAQFNDPEDCRKFSYLVQGFKVRLVNGEYRKDATAFNRSEEIRMMKKLEKSARQAKDYLFSSKITEVLDEKC
jgi:hypothetical protein